MYNEILSALRTRFEGVSDNILGRIATRLAKTATTAEQVNTAVDGITFQQVLESYGDSRATEASQTAVLNYESKHGLKDGQRTDEQGVEPQPKKPRKKPSEEVEPDENDQTPDWAKALLSANKALSERLAKMEGERVSVGRKEKLQSIISKLPESLRKPYERTSVEALTDEQFAALVGEVTTEVDGIAASLQQKGAIFGRPQNGTPLQGSGKEATDKETEAVVGRFNLD